MRILISCLIFCSLVISTYANTTEYTHPDGSHVSITIPTGLHEAVEKTVRDEIQSILPSTLVTPSKDPTMMTGESMDPQNWEHTINVKKIYSDSKITSVLINSYEYTGGAHGASARLGLVLDTQTGKRLALTDFYDTKELTSRLSPVWEKQIAIRLESMLGKKLTGDDKNWIRDGSSDIQQYQSFILTPRTLTVYGQQYQHNAYAYGMQTLVYPRHRLQDISR